MPVANDYFVAFSKEEYERRYQMIREAMKGKGLDCLLVYAAHNFAGTDMGEIQATYLTA